MALAQGFVPIDKSKHDLKSFKCGKPDMDEFLYRYALSHSKSGISKTWILCEDTQLQKEQVVAYFTLSSVMAHREEIPTTKSYPKYQLPVVLIARIAVSQNYQKQRLGEKSLICAIREAVSITDIGLPATGIVLDVLDNDALAFYQKFELFEEFKNDPRRLYISMHVARQI